jgi:hypothetical protein
MLDEALAMALRLLPSDHPDIAITRSGMAVLLLETERADEARQMASAAGEALASSFGPEHWRVAWARTIQGASYAELHSFADAEPLLLDGYARLSEAAGGRKMQIDFARRRLVRLYTTWGRPAEATRFSLPREI